MKGGSRLITRPSQPAAAAGSRPETLPGTLRTFRDVGLAAVCVALVDLCLHCAVAPGSLPAPALPYAAHLVTLSVAAIVVHVAPFIAAIRWLGTRTGHHELVVCIACGLFGFSWQSTLASGAGVRAHPLSFWIRLALATLVPLALCSVAKLAVDSTGKRLRLLHRALPLVLVLGAGGLSSLKWYRGFHAHLALALVVLLLYGLGAKAVSRTVERAAAAVAGLALAVFLATWSDRVPLEGRILRESYVASPLMAKLPLARLYRAAPELVVDLDRRARPSPGEPVPGLPSAEAIVSRRARSVILLVLEAVRWEYWADATIAPRFHRLRREGLYFPRAIAPYPGTPLAYGAIFVGQPPSVLLATGCWAKPRPFDAIRRNFERMSLSRPRAPWFDNPTLTDFFAERNTVPPAHADARQALDLARRAIESAAGRSFFVWSHLYEPHAPYRAHPGLHFGDDEKSRYRSEVAYLDAEVGRFLEWFQGRPESGETLLVIVADHGEGLGDPSHGEPILFHSFDVHGVLTAVPLYLQGPGIPPNVTELDLVVSQLDIMPTLFDALGETLPPELLIQGRSLYRLLEEREERSAVSEQFELDGQAFYDLVRDAARLEPEVRRERFLELSRDPLIATRIALRYRRWKLTYDRLLRKFWLHDVGVDPFERNDLSTSRPEVVRDMQQRLRAWLDTQAFIIDELGR